MKKVIAKTKEMAKVLGFTAIVKALKANSTTDEVYGYLLLMCNYMMAHPNCTEEQREKIVNSIKLLGVQLNFVSGESYKLAA